MFLLGRFFLNSRLFSPAFQKLPHQGFVFQENIGVCPSVIFRGQFRAEYALIPLEDDLMQSSQPPGESKGRRDFRREDE